MILLKYKSPYTEAVKVDSPEKKGIPPTYLHCLKHHLGQKGRSNINDRDRRLLQYIRSLQEIKRRPGKNPFNP